MDQYFIEKVLEELEVERDSQYGLRAEVGIVGVDAEYLLADKVPRLEKLCLLAKDVVSASSPSPLSCGGLFNVVGGENNRL